MKERNTPIGEVECPHKGCAERASVFKFRQRAKEPWARRRAGKLYSACAHGHRSEDQDYLLEHATIWGAAEKADGGESAPAADKSAPVKTPPKSTAAPVPTAPARQAPAPVKAPAPERKKSTGWGWFQ